MQEFLKTVAIHYAEKAKYESAETGQPASLPLSRYLFCFPNRRCGLFFSKYLGEAFGGPCFVPSITTISELFSYFSERQVLDRTTLLFRLFSLYNKLSQRPDKEEFDQFVFWGDMLLSDFNDVDEYLVDADALFQNVKDLKDIEDVFAGYDPEIVEVIQSFWHNYKPAGSADDPKREAFGQTWSILKNLYHAFKEDLAKDNLAYEGMLEREVIDSIQHGEADLGQMLDAANIKKVVFVGLTAISKTERKLMLSLKLHDLADFCWDYADPRLRLSEAKATSASYFTSQNLSDFPNEIPEEDLQAGLVPEKERQYSLFAIPSGVGQTQMVRQLLLQWNEDIQTNPLRTAVVLPDEQLLIPLLYAIPKEVGKFNVTMGYGLKDTPVASFIELLAALHEGMREKEDGTITFYYKPVLSILSHNFARTLASDVNQLLIEKITKDNLYRVGTDVFQQSEFLSLLFRPLHNASQTIHYLLEVLAFIMGKAQEEIERNAAEEDEPTLFDEDKSKSLPQFTVTDHEFLYHYNRTLEKLAEIVDSQTFSFTPRTLFHLLQRLIAGVSVPFTGEPLHGIQVMGVLETRGMDFDNVIILSMNEGVFPAKPVTNTFVPMSLRNAFEMPTQKHKDAVFAYHFYRLISRAHHVAMIYDSRAEGMQTGEESRYVKQLRYLMGHADLSPLTVHNDISIVKGQSFEIQKTPAVMQLLQKYTVENGNRSLSASAMNDYIQCPMRFYLSYVESLKEEDEVSEGVDNRFFGDILHHALNNLYAKAEDKRVDADLLRKYIDHPEGEITEQILRGFEEVMDVKNPEGYNLLVVRILVRYAIETLRYDMTRCPFHYLAGEKIAKMSFPVNPQLNVSIKCIFDRLERNEIGEECLHVIDYKTGNSSHGGKLHLRSIEDMFLPEGKASHEAFQVMFYCLMLNYANDRELKGMFLKQLPRRITPHLFFVRDFKKGKENVTLLNISNGKEQTVIDDFSPYRDPVEEGVRKLLTEIFDPEIPFRQCDNPRQCIYCRFSSICKR